MFLEKNFRKEVSYMNIEESNNLMGKRIKSLRKDKGLTQEELGKVIGVKKQTIMKYEKGIVENIKRSAIEKLANFFKVSPSYLMGIEDDNFEEENIKFANASGIDTDGLTEDEIEEIKKQVEFMKWKKKNGDK